MDWAGFLNSGFFFYGLVAIFFIIALLFKKKRSEKLKKILKQQALQRNGHVTGGGMFAVLQLFFPHEDLEIEILLLPGGRNTPPYTYVKCGLPLMREFRILISREYSGISKIGRIFGMQDFQINNPDFDKSFVIQASDEMIVRNLLTPEIQDRLLQIKDKNPRLEIKQNRFKFSIARIPRESHEYNPLIDTALLVISRLRELG